MKRSPSRGGSWACAVLVVVLIATALLATNVVVAVAVAPVIAGLLSIELDRRGGPIATGIVRAAGRLLPANARQQNADEWVDHVLSEGGVGLRPVLVALEIAFLGAPRIAWRLRVRPLAGRYVFALFLTAVQVAQADPDERRRGSTISATKAVVRLSAMFVTPLLALAVVRRFERVLPRWLLYAIGCAIYMALSTLTIGYPIWLGLVVFSGMSIVTMSVGMLVVLKTELIVRFASRLMGMPDDA